MLTALAMILLAAAIALGAFESARQASRIDALERSLEAHKSAMKWLCEDKEEVPVTAQPTQPTGSMATRERVPQQNHSITNDV